ncbi:putative Phosphatidylinositol 3- and 4-kinase [Trypanosoma cruzi]|nr:putative Phosphatidylinositol 3- and 4-kinase [Trypanosoma cruzi]
MTVEEIFFSLRADVAALRFLLVGLQGSASDACHVFDNMERRLRSSKIAFFSAHETVPLLECVLSNEESGLLRVLNDYCEKMRFFGTDARDARVLKRAMSFFNLFFESFQESVTIPQVEEVHSTVWHTFMLLHRLSKHVEVQAECLGVLSALLRSCGQRLSPARLDVAKVVEVCVLILERKITSGLRLRSNAMRLLGCMCGVYTTLMSPHAMRILHALVSVGQHLVASDEVEQVIGEGLLLAFSDYSGGFPLVFNGPDRDTLMLMYHLIKKAILLAGTCQNYRFCKAALALLGKRADFLKECLMNDMQDCFTALRHLWSHRNVEVRRATHAATAGFFRALALSWSGDNQRHDLAPRLRYMLHALEATMRDKQGKSRDLSFAIMAFGYMARPLVSCFGVDYLALTFHEMVKRCEVLLTLTSGPVEDVVRLLPYFLSALASMLLELPPMGSELPQLLNFTLHTTLFLYPRGMCSENIRSTFGSALLKLLAAILYCHGVEFGVVLVARWLLALACVSFSCWDPKKGLPTAVEDVNMQKSYILLWESLQSHSHSVLDWGSPWNLSISDAMLDSLRMALRRELVSAELEMLRQFDVSLLSTEEEARDGGDTDFHWPVVHELGEMQLCSMEDCNAFLRFTSFFIGSLDATFSEAIGLEEVAAILVEALVSFATRHTQIAGGYTCLHELLQAGWRAGLSLSHAWIFLRSFSRTCLNCLTIYTDELQLQSALCMISMSHFGLLETAQLLYPIEVVIRHADDTAAVADALEVLDCCLEKDRALVMPPFCALLSQLTVFNPAFGQLHSLLVRHGAQLGDGVRRGVKDEVLECRHGTTPALPCLRRHMDGAQLPLPMGSTTLFLPLGSLLPRATMLSFQEKDCQLRLAACELLRAAVGWCIEHNVDDLYGELFDTVIVLAGASAAGSGIQVMFGALLRQCARCFALRGGRGAKVMENAIFRGTAVPHNASIRRVSIEALAEYVQWSLKYELRLQLLQEDGAQESQLKSVLLWVCLTLRGPSAWQRLGAAGVLDRLLHLLRCERAALPFVVPFTRALLAALASMRMNEWDGGDEREGDGGGRAAVSLAGNLCRCVRRLEVYVATNCELLVHMWQDRNVAEENEAVLRDILLHAYREGCHTASGAALLRLFAAICRCMPGYTEGDVGPRRWLLTHLSILRDFDLRETIPGRRLECGLQMHYMLVSNALFPSTLKRTRTEDASLDEESTCFRRVLEELDRYVAESAAGCSDSACISARVLFIARHLVRVLSGEVGTVASKLLLLNRSLPQFAARLLLAPTSLGITPGPYYEVQRLCGRELVAALSVSLRSDEGRFRELVDCLREHVPATLWLTPQPNLLEFFLSDPHTAVHTLRSLAVLVDLGLWAEVLLLPSLSHVIQRRLLEGLLEAVRDECVVNSQWGTIFCHMLLLLLLSPLPPPSLDDAKARKGGENVTNVPKGFGLREVLSAVQRDEERFVDRKTSPVFLAAILRGDWRDAGKNGATLRYLLTELFQVCGELLQRSGESSLQSAPFVALRGLLHDVHQGPKPAAETWALAMKRGVDALMHIGRGGSPAVLAFFLEVHRCCLRVGGSHFLACHEYDILVDISAAVDGERWTMRPHALLTSRVAVHLFVQGVDVLCDAVAAASAGNERPTQPYATLVEQLMRRAINDELPLDWREVDDGSINGIHYAFVVRALIRIVRCTAALDAALLLSLVPLLHQTDMPQYTALVTAVSSVLQKLPSEALVELCHKSRELQQQCGLPWAVWWGLTHRLLLPSLRRLLPAVRDKFFLQHVVGLVEEASAPPSGAATLQRKTRALIMLEAVFDMTAASVLRGPINAAFTGKKDGSSGKELIIALIKACCAARVFVPPATFSPEAFHDALNYRQSAHRCLVAVLVATQEQEKVFTRLLLNSPGGGVWNQIVDTSFKHFFHVETNFPYMTECRAKECSDWEVRKCVATFQRLAESNTGILRQGTGAEVQCVYAVDNAVDHTFLTANLPWLSHALVMHDEGDDKPHNRKREEKENRAPRVKLDGVWISTCFGALLRVTDFLLSRFAVNPADGWVKEIIGLFSSTAIHVNVRLVLARLIQMRASSFTPAANALRDSLVSLVCEEGMGEGGVHYVARDLLELLFHWGETGAMNFTAEAARKLMLFLFRDAPHPSADVMQHNLDLVRRLVSLLKPLSPVCDRDLLHVLRGQVLAFRFGIRMCGLLIDNGVLLSSVAPASLVDLYHALVSCFNRNKNIATVEEEELLVVADVVGKELRGLRDFAETDALLLRDTVRSALLCLWSRSPGVALRVLSAIVQHDSGVVEDIPLSTLLANFMSRDATEQLAALHVIKCTLSRAAEAYATLHDIFSGHLFTLSAPVRVALYYLLVELFPLLTAAEKESFMNAFLSPDAMQIMCGSEDTNLAFFKLAVRVYEVAPSSFLLARVAEGLKEPLPSVRFMLLEFLDAHVLPRDSYVSRLAALKEAITPQTVGHDVWLKHAAVLTLSLCHTAGAACPATGNLIASPPSFAFLGPCFLNDPLKRHGVSHELCPRASRGGLPGAHSESEDLFLQRHREEGAEKPEASITRALPVCSEAEFVGFQVPSESFVAPLQLLCMHDTETARCFLGHIEGSVAV